MNEKRTKSGFAFVLITILLGFCLTIGSVLYQRHPDPTCHGGGLSAGFPLPFICDDSAGSPISSWGKIDLADILNINPRVLLLDFLLYNALASLILVAVAGIFRKGLVHVELFRWAILFCAVCMLVFLFAFTAFQSDNLNFEIPLPRTPTPFVPSPTPYGTPPPLPPVAPT
jgi:hypothetical protein